MGIHLAYRWYNICKEEIIIPHTYFAMTIKYDNFTEGFNSVLGI